jgi:molecular chaperone DnaK (HSP70)
VFRQPPDDPPVSETIVGIDLGTSNSVVAYEDELGRVSVLADNDGTTIHPSVVAFMDGRMGGGIVVGPAAKAQKVIDPANTIYSFKRLVGRSIGTPAVDRLRARVPYMIKDGPHQLPVVETRSGDFSATELSGIVLDHLRGIAKARLGRPIKHAVVTVPAHFNEAQRSATQSAGEIAGLDVVRVLNEPTAAALAYGNTRRLHEIIAVYDFGGGTFDTTIMKFENQVYSVLGTAGDSFLGGDDVDERLVERMLAKILVERRIDLSGNTIAMMRLRGIAEETKIALSERPSTRVELGTIGGTVLNFGFELTRDELMVIISELVDRTFAVTAEALAVAGISKDRVADVILVGGTTKIPYVRDRVARFFDKAARTDISPENAVAIGAAHQAASLEQLMLRQPGKPIGVPLSAEPEALLDLDDPNTEIEFMFGIPTRNQGVRAEVPAALPTSAPLAEVSVVPALGSMVPAPVAPIARPVVIDVTPSGFGLGTMGGFCEMLIPRSSPLPVEMKRLFTTVRDNQDHVRIVVCQGETRRLSTNVELGHVVLHDLRPCPRGEVSIEVTFMLDTSGMLQVTARDAETGQIQRVELDLVGRMDEHEVAASRERMQQLRR